MYIKLEKKYSFGVVKEIKFLVDFNHYAIGSLELLVKVTFQESMDVIKFNKREVSLIAYLRVWN